MRDRQQKCSKNRQFLANNSPYLRNGARQDYSHNDRLIGSRIRTFDWYQNHQPWMTLNDHERPKRTLVQKRCVFGAHWTNLNEDRPIHAATKIQANNSSFWKYKVYEFISGDSSWRGPQMRVWLLAIAIFGDLIGYFFANFRDKASNIIRWPCTARLLLRRVTVCVWGKPSRYTTRHLGQLSLPFIRGRQIA